MILRYSSDIARRFRKTITDPIEEDSPKPQPEPKNPGEVKLSITKWLDNVSSGLEEIALVDSELDGRDTPDGDDEQEDPHLPERDGYRNITFNSPAFKWLLASLGKEILLGPVDSFECISRLRAQIIKALPQVHSISTRTPPKAYWMKFTLDCDLHAFIGDQYGSPERASRLAEIITLTGSANDAQAMTAEEYMKQVWPYTGKDVLDVIQTALDKNSYAGSKLLLSFFYSQTTDVLCLLIWICLLQKDLQTER